VPDGYEALARAALAEVTAAESVGELLGVEAPADGVTDLAFASRLSGYVGWRWMVSMAQVPDAGPSVLEVELLPGDGSLLAPPWVPWAERLAEYRRTHPDDADAVEVEDELDDEDDELDPDEDVLDDEVDDELDGVDFEAPGGAEEADVLLDEELDDEAGLDGDDEPTDEGDPEEGPSAPAAPAGEEPRSEG
jgi:hypothetical protein